MPRPVTWGTPSRADHYPKLRRRFGLFLPAVELGGVAIVVLVVAQVAGWKGAFSPGSVSAKHGVYDSRCQECHISRQGASNVRCQRCHDPSSAGRLDNAAHVYFGSLDPAKAAAAPELRCALCHVEHHGRGAMLARVDEAHCRDCHADKAKVPRRIEDFASHPEFRVLREKQRPSAGIIFSHLTHVTKGKKKPTGYVMADRKLDQPSKTCPECHQRRPESEDFDPLTFETACLSCHRGDLKVDPVKSAEVTPIAMIDEDLTGSWSARPSDFEQDGADLVKVRVVHKDEWILFNLKALSRALDPQSFETERARLLARRSRLERRLALATPPAEQDLAALEQRAATLQEEIRYFDRRLAARKQAVDPLADLDRLQEVLGAALAAGQDADQTAARELLAQGQSLRQRKGGAAPLSRDEFLAKRSDLLRILDAVEKADPARKAQAEELRRRLAQLSPGADDEGVLVRARAQRQATLDRIRDEIRLRRSGTPPPSATLLEGERRAIRRALDQTTSRIRFLDRVPEPAGELDAQERVRKQEAVAALTKGCRICHAVSADGILPPVKAAKSVLWRATFQHREHLVKGETCASCHSGGQDASKWSVETSDKSSDLDFEGVARCRECHRSGEASTDCQECHHYHPPTVP